MVNHAITVAKPTKKSASLPLIPLLQKTEGVSNLTHPLTLMDTYRVKLTASCSPDELAGPVLCEFTETSI